MKIGKWEARGNYALIGATVLFGGLSIAFRKKYFGRLAAATIGLGCATAGLGFYRWNKIQSEVPPNDRKSALADLSRQAGELEEAIAKLRPDIASKMMELDDLTNLSDQELQTKLHLWTTDVIPCIQAVLKDLSKSVLSLWDQPLANCYYKVSHESFDAVIGRFQAGCKFNTNSQEQKNLLIAIEETGMSLLGLYRDFCTHVSFGDRVRGAAALLFRGRFVPPSPKIAMQGMVECLMLSHRQRKKRGESLSEV